MACMGEQEFAARECVLASFGPLLFLSKIPKLDADVSDLVFDDLVRHLR